MRTLIAGVLLLSVSSAFAQQPVLPSALKAPDTTVDSKSSTDLLEKTLRTLLLANLPNPLLTAPHGWDNQKEVTIGVVWKRTGAIRLKPEAMKAVRNDGHWQKVTVTAVEPEKSLTVKLSHIQPDGAKTQFDVDLGLDVRLVYEQQMWAMGKRIYAGETRAKCHADLKLKAEVTEQLDYKPKALLPDVTLKLKVTSADLLYRDLECEHTLGVGGEAAKLLGKAIHEIIRKVKPQLEKDLLAKANASIIKATDDKEVRIELQKLLQAKPSEKK